METYGKPYIYFNFCNGYWLGWLGCNNILLCTAQSRTRVSSYTFHNFVSLIEKPLVQPGTLLCLPMWFNYGWPQRKYTRKQYWCQHSHLCPLSHPSRQNEEGAREYLQGKYKKKDLRAFMNGNTILTFWYFFSGFIICVFSGYEAWRHHLV